MSGRSNTVGIVERPDLISTAPRESGDLVSRCVPHSPQNSRVTGFGRSPRRNCFGVPFTYLKPPSGMGGDDVGVARRRCTGTPAVALALEHRIAFGAVARAAVTSTFECHSRPSLVGVPVRPATDRTRSATEAATMTRRHERWQGAAPPRRRSPAEGHRWQPGPRRASVLSAAASEVRPARPAQLLGMARRGLPGPAGRGGLASSAAVRKRKRSRRPGPKAASTAPDDLRARARCAQRHLDRAVGSEYGTRPRRGTQGVALAGKHEVDLLAGCSDDGELHGLGRHRSTPPLHLDRPRCPRQQAGAAAAEHRTATNFVGGLHRGTSTSAPIAAPSASADMSSIADELVSVAEDTARTQRRARRERSAHAGAIACAHGSAAPRDGAARVGRRARAGTRAGAAAHVLERGHMRARSALDPHQVQTERRRDPACRPPTGNASSALANLTECRPSASCVPSTMLPRANGSPSAAAAVKPRARRSSSNDAASFARAAPRRARLRYTCRARTRAGVAKRSGCAAIQARSSFSSGRSLAAGRASARRAARRGSGAARRRRPRGRRHAPPRSARRRAPPRCRPSPGTARDAAGGRAPRIVDRDRGRGGPVQQVVVARGSRGRARVRRCSAGRARGEGLVDHRARAAAAAATRRSSRAAPRAPAARRPRAAAAVVRAAASRRRPLGREPRVVAVPAAYAPPR